MRRLLVALGCLGMILTSDAARDRGRGVYTDGFQPQYEEAAPPRMANFVPFPENLTARPECMSRISAYREGAGVFDVLDVDCDNRPDVICYENGNCSYSPSFERFCMDRRAAIMTGSEFDMASKVLADIGKLENACRH